MLWAQEMSFHPTETPCTLPPPGIVTKFQGEIGKLSELEATVVSKAQLTWGRLLVSHLRSESRIHCVHRKSSSTGKGNVIQSAVQPQGVRAGPV